MKEKIKKHLSKNTLPYYRHPIYNGDILRPIITFTFFFLAYLIWKFLGGWAGFIVAILLVLISALFGFFICRFFTPGKMRMLLSVVEPLLILLTMVLALVKLQGIHAEIWENTLAFTMTIPLFEMAIYALSMPIITLANDPTIQSFFVKTVRICLLLVILPELLTLCVIYIKTIWPTSKQDILEATFTQWKQIHIWFFTLITDNLSLVLSMLLLIVTTWGIATNFRNTTKRHAFHDSWVTIHDTLLQNVAIWIQHVFKPRSRIKFWGNKEQEAREHIENLVIRGSGETKRLWNLLIFFSDKDNLDSPIKKVISTNNLYPLLNAEEDGDKTVRELFDSAIVMFAEQSAKDCGSYTTLKTRISGFNSLENWKKYFKLKHDVSQINFDILNRVYISYVKEKQSS